MVWMIVKEHVSTRHTDHGPGTMSRAVSLGSHGGSGATLLECSGAGGARCAEASSTARSTSVPTHAVARTRGAGPICDRSSSSRIRASSSLAACRAACRAAFCCVLQRRWMGISQMQAACVNISAAHPITNVHMITIVTAKKSNSNAGGGGGRVGGHGGAS